MYQHVNLSLSVFYNYISEYAFIHFLFYLSEIVKTIIVIPYIYIYIYI